jgi:nuclear receptor subfamily 1 group F member 4
MVMLFQDVGRILYYKNMNQEELWLDCAEKLTAMIQNIIEFAKLIPGFMRLSQDDQVSPDPTRSNFIGR